MTMPNFDALLSIAGPQSSPLDELLQSGPLQAQAHSGHGSPVPGGTPPGLPTLMPSAPIRPPMPPAVVPYAGGTGAGNSIAELIRSAGPMIGALLMGGNTPKATGFMGGFQQGQQIAAEERDKRQQKDQQRKIALVKYRDSIFEQAGQITNPQQWAAFVDQATQSAMDMGLAKDPAEIKGYLQYPAELARVQQQKGLLERLDALTKAGYDLADLADQDASVTMNGRPIKIRSLITLAGALPMDATGAPLKAKKKVEPMAVGPDQTVIDKNNPNAAPLYVGPGKPEKPEHSAIYKEWQDYKSTGGTLDFNAYQNMDANRKRPLSVTNQATDDAMIKAAAQNILANPRDLTSIRTITSLRGDQRLKLFNEIKRLNPEFNVGMIDRQIKFLDSYEDPKGRAALNRQSMNNILMHAADLSDVNQEYRRTNLRIANTPLNEIAKQSSEAWQRYQTTIDVLREEIGLYFSGGYAPDSEQKKAWEQILNGDATPNQIEAFAKQIIHVGLRRASTHNSDFKTMMGYDDPNLITPDAVTAGEHLGLGAEVKKFGSGGQFGKAVKKDPLGIR